MAFEPVYLRVHLCLSITPGHTANASKVAVVFVLLLALPINIGGKWFDYILYIKQRQFEYFNQHPPAVKLMSCYSVSKWNIVK